jgi:hypothetical protein
VNETDRSYQHRWARLLKQQSSITVHRLPTKEKKTFVFFRLRFQQLKGSLSFPFSAYSKQREVAVFR